jgi:aminoglycoside phosphotransferase (APT) family kinase protein
VHGDFIEQNILVDAEGRPYLLDFERVGIGSEDHDFTSFWIHSQRSSEWKRKLLARWFATHVGSDRIRSEWGIRAALVYLALRRLRFGYLMYGGQDEHATANLALLDAALDGGAALFPLD